MAWSRSQAAEAAERLHRAIAIDVKIERVSAAASIPIDEDDNLAITNPAQVAAYITALTNRRDALVASIKPIVAGL